MATITEHGTTLIARSKPRVYSASEWEGKREIITEFWSNKQSQKEILLSMEEQFPDFRPTLAMLKRRLRQWGMNRYHREADVAEALRLAYQRDAQSKETAFIIGGRQITREQIDHYLYRKGIRDVRAFVPKSSKQATTSVIKSYTPPQTPINEDALDGVEPMDPVGQAQSEEAISAGPNECLLPTSRDLFSIRWESHPIQALLAGPPELELLLKALKSNDAYYHSILVSQTMVTSPATSPVEPDGLSIFTNAMWTGREHLMDKQIRRAFQYFEKAFDAIPLVVSSPNRKFLPELFEMLLNFQLEQDFDILYPLLQFTTQLHHGTRNDLISQIVAPLLRMSQADRVNAAERLMQNVLDHFRGYVGTDHPETKSIVKALSRSVFRRKPVSEAIGHLQALLRDSHTIASMGLYEYCNLLIEMTLCYRAQFRLDDATEWIERASLQADRLPSLFHQSDVKIRCLRIMSHVEKKRGDWKASCEYAKQAVAMSERGLGNEDSLTALVQAELAEVLEEATCQEL